MGRSRIEGILAPAESDEGLLSFSAMVASPSWLLRKRIAGYFRDRPGVSFLGDAEDCAQMINRVNSSRPDLLFIDACTCAGHKTGGLLCAVHLRPETRVIVTCRDLDVDLVVESLKEGVRGLLLESAPAHEFWKAAATVMRGDIWMPRTLLLSAFKMALREQQLPSEVSPAPDDKLTQREREIASLICQGKSDKDVARLLNISEKTIKTHLQNIYRKLGVHGRLELALGQRSPPPVEAAPRTAS